MMSKIENVGQVLEEGQFHDGNGRVNVTPSYGNAIKNTLQGAFMLAVGPAVGVLGVFQSIATKSPDWIAMGSVMSAGMGGAFGFMGYQAVKEGVRELKYLRQQAAPNKSGPSF